MLKGISPLLSPYLLKILMEMGHGDEIVLGDRNFPAAAVAKKIIRCDGHGIPPLLEAILPLFPLDSFVDQPVALMEVVPGDDFLPEIWETYRNILQRFKNLKKDFKMIERFAFYERAKNAYAVIATGEKSFYANIILKKGVIPPEL